MGYIGGFYHDIDAWELPPYWKLPVKKHRRARFNDYYGRRIYLVTVFKQPETPLLSSIVGFTDSVEDPVRVNLSPVGELVERSLTAISVKFPHCSIIDKVIMPDHVHFIIFVKKKTSIHLGTIVARFTGDCSRVLADYRCGGNQLPAKIAGAVSSYSDSEKEEISSFFEPGYDDSILYGKGQLQKMIDYVRDNPLRYAIKRSNPDLFRRSLVITGDGVCFHAFGNLFLLKNTERKAVRLSRKFSKEETARRLGLWEETCRNGGVLVSPFISKAEKDVRDKALREGASIILIAPTGFNQREKPSGQAFSLCAEGRLLILSNPGTYAGTGVLTRQECMDMNSLAEKIAETDFSSLRFRKVTDEGDRRN